MRRGLAIIFVLFSTVAFAQQEWVYTMQALNMYDGNAAAAGMYETGSINLRYRSQFTGIDGAPRTLMATGNGQVGQVGVGMRIQMDAFGIFSRSTAVVHAAYAVKTGNGELRFGLGGGLSTVRLDNVVLPSPVAPEDPAVNAPMGERVPVVQGALMYRNQKFFLGAELNNAFANESVTGLDTQREVLAMFGLQHKLNADWSLRPMLAARWNDSGNLLPEGQLGLWLKEMVWLGAGYRWDAEAYGFLEYRVKRKVRIAYSFGTSTSLSGLGANHEVMLGYIFPGKNRSIQNIRYFQ